MSNLETLLNTNLDSVLNVATPNKDERNLYSKMDTLYHQLVEINIDPNQVSIDQMCQLMQVFQAVLQHKNDNLIETRETLKTQDEQVHDQELEIKRLRMLQKQGSSQDRDMMDLQDELINLERKYDSATRDIESLTEMLEQERQINSNVLAASKEDYVKMTVLNNTNKKLELDLRELRMQLTAQRGRLTSRLGDEDGQKALIHQKNVEINRFIEENTNLNSVNECLTVDLEEVTNELQAAMEELDSKNQEIKNLNKELEECTGKMQALEDERDVLRARIEDLGDGVDKERTRQRRLVDGIEKDLEYYQNQCKALESSRQDLESKLKKYEEKFQRVSSQESAVLIDKLEAEIESKNKEIETLQWNVKNITNDFELLALDWDKMDKESKSKNPKRSEIVNKHKQLTSDEKAQLNQRIDYLTKAQAKDRAKIDDLAKIITEKEAEILDQRLHLEKYENGQFGLKDSIAEIKVWKARHQIAEKQCHEYIKKVSDLECQAADLAEEVVALRERLGLPFTGIDISNFKNIKLVELEQTKSLVKTLQDEIEKLEEERIELKNKLRFNTMKTSANNQPGNLGLEMSDLLALEDYCSRLKSGKLKAEQLFEFRPPIQSLDKLFEQIENIVSNWDQESKKLQEQEIQIVKLEQECQIYEQALVELSRTFAGTEIDNDGEKNPLFDQLIALLHAKLGANTKIEKFMEQGGIPLIKSLKDELHSTRDQLKKITAEKNELVAKLTEMSNRSKELSSELAQAQKLEPNLSDLKDLVRELMQGEIKDEVLLGSLLTTLSALESKERLLETKNELLLNYESKMKSLAAKSKLLFNKFSSLKVESESTNCKLLKEIEIKDTELAVLKIKLTRSEEALMASATSPESSEENEKTFHRQLVVAQVESEKLRRNVQILEISEKHNVLVVKRLTTAIYDLERASRNTIARLRLSRDELTHRLTAVTNELAASIPQSEYQELQKMLRCYIKKYKMLIEKSPDPESVTIHERIDQLATKHYEWKIKAAKFDEIVSQSFHGDEHPAEDKHSEQSWLNKFSALEVQHKILAEKLNMYESKLSRCKQDLNQVCSIYKKQKELEDCEARYISDKEELFKIQELVTHFRDLEGNAICHIGAENELESVKARLDDEVRERKHQKSLCDSATEQCERLIRQRNGLAEQVELLRSTMSDVRNKDDGAAIVAKLQLELIQLKERDFNHIIEIDDLKAKSMKLENIIANQDTVIMSLQKSEHDRRIKSRKYSLFVKKCNSNLSSKVVGMVTLEKYDRMCHSVKLLRETVTTLQHKIMEITSFSDELADRISAEDALLSAKNELEEIIRTSNHSKRLMEWFAKTTTLETKLKGTLRKLESITTSFNEIREKYNKQEDFLAALQEELDYTQEVSDRKDLEAESQLLALEEEIAGYQGERDRIFLTMTTQDYMEAMPDQGLTIHQQLETIKRNFIASIKVRKLLVVHNEELSKDNEQIRIDLQSLQKLVLNLRAKIPPNHEEFGRATSSISEIEKDRVLLPSDGNSTHDFQVTLGALQNQLEQQNITIIKYRQMIKNARKELIELAVTLTNQQEKASIICKNEDKMHEFQVKEIERIKLKSSQAVMADDYPGQIDTLETIDEGQLISKETIFFQQKKIIDEFKSDLERLEVDLNLQERINLELRAEIQARDAISKSLVKKTLGELEVSPKQRRQTFRVLKRTITGSKASSAETESMAQSSLKVATQTEDRITPLVFKISNMERKIRSNGEVIANLKSQNHDLTTATRLAVDEKKALFNEITELTESCVLYMKRLEAANLLTTQEKSSLEARIVILRKQNLQSGSIFHSVMEIERNLHKKLDAMKSQLKSYKNRVFDLTSKLEIARESYSKSEAEKSKFQLSLKRFKESANGTCKVEAFREKSIEGGKDPEDSHKAIVSMTDLRGHDFRSLSMTEAELLLGKKPNELVVVIDVLKQEVLRLKTTYHCLSKKFKLLEAQNQDTNGKNLVETPQGDSSRTETLLNELKKLQTLYRNEVARNKAYAQELSLKISIPESNSRKIENPKEGLLQVSSQATLLSENRRLTLQIENLKVRIRKLVQERSNINLPYTTSSNHGTIAFRTEHDSYKQQLEDSQSYYSEAVRTHSLAQ